MVKKFLYSLFVGTTLLVVLAFVTAQTYTQLGLAAFLYPWLVLFAYLLFRQNRRVSHPMAQNTPGTAPVVLQANEDEGIIDQDKREFLKMIGIAGVSFFLFSLFSRRSESLFFGRAGALDTGGTTGLEDANGKKINPSERQPTDGYRISEIDDSGEDAYYGFIRNDGAWYIMKESSADGSFRYLKGDANFPGSWPQHTKLTYGYYNDIFS